MATGGSAGTGATGGSGGGNMGGAAGMGMAGFGGGMVVCLPDADGDNIPDNVEGAPDRDTDMDGTPDFQDEDSDDDTIPDRLEADTARIGCEVPLDSDRDGTPNHLDTDSDNNTIPDRDEAGFDGMGNLSDVDMDALPDVYDNDNDGDTLIDLDELVNGAGVDTDMDGADDHNDFDADGDNVGDGFEGLSDADGDGRPNFRDLDSDSDTVPDLCEGDSTRPLADPPPDSDSDGKFDITDIDSDNDGLRDGVEDANANCSVEIGETDRTLADTDADGANDLIETVLDTDPSCGVFGGNPVKACTPGEGGKYFFIMPFNQTPQPAQQDVVLKTNLNKGDIAFVVDSSGTMGPAIDNIRTNLNTIVDSIKADVPDANFGVLAHEDFPVLPVGHCVDDLPARLPAGTDSFLTGDITMTRNSVNSLTTGNGVDGPESQVAALFRAIKDELINWPGTCQGGSLAAYGPGGAFGGLGFRGDALPILVSITDAPFHNGIYVDQTTVHDDYAFGAGFFDKTSADLVAEMNAVGAKFVGIALNNGGFNREADPYDDMAYITDATNSNVMPAAFNSTQCLTDIVPVQPDGPTGPGIPPTCRLIFSAFTTGVGVSTRIADGVKALLRGINLEVRILAANDLAFSNPPTIRPIEDFVDHIEVFAPGQVSDPSAPGEFCETLDIQDLRDNWADPFGTVVGPDSFNETAAAVTPGTRVCFRIIPKNNTLYPQTNDVQFARAFLTVKARNEGQIEELDVGEARDVFFVIPPTSQ